MSFNNVVPGYVMRDPEKLAALMEELGYPSAPIVRKEGAPSSVLQSVLPGMEDLTVEDETPDAQYMDELGTGNLPTFVYAAVNPLDGKLDKKNAIYDSLRGAKAYAASRWGSGSVVVKGEVTWEEL